MKFISRKCIHFCAYFLLAQGVLVGFLNCQASAIDFNLGADLLYTATSLSSSDAATFSTLPGRSYCLEVKTQSSGALAAVQASTVSDSDLVLASSSRGNASPPVYTPRTIGFSDLARKCFVVSGVASAITSYRVRSTFTFSSGTTAGTTSLQLFDTTLSGGFNTSVTDFNFLELTNTLTSIGSDSGVITGTITAKNVLTDTVALTRTFTVNAGDRVDINIHDSVGPDVFGIVTVSHNGPPGSLKGVVSQYRLVSLSPFDFEPVLQQPLLRANGLP